MGGLSCFSCRSYECSIPEISGEDRSRSRWRTDGCYRFGGLGVPGLEKLGEVEELAELGLSVPRSGCSVWNGERYSQK